jgi:hypothetical protein
MNKFLLVEPDKMLRHAFMVALYPDFQVQVLDALPKEAPKEFDAVIVDGTALKGRETHFIAEWHLPMVWIGGDASMQLPPAERCVRLNWPVAKESLRQALAQCLSARATPMAKTAAGVEAANPGVKAKRQAQKAAKDTPPAGKFIELVDVVEEEALG